MSTPVPMSAPVQRIAELFERNLSIRHVYDEPVRNGDVTVIPVAKASFKFGSGGGLRARLRRRGQGIEGAETSDVDGRETPDGLGAGGGARLTPVGALVVGPRRTRFIRYSRLPQMLGILALGVAAGLLVASPRRPRGRLRPLVRKLTKRMHF